MATSSLLLEDSSFLLLEDGVSHLLLEDSGTADDAPPPPQPGGVGGRKAHGPQFHSPIFPSSEDSPPNWLPAVDTEEAVEPVLPATPEPEIIEPPPKLGSSPLPILLKAEALTIQGRSLTEIREQQLADDDDAIVAILSALKH